MIKKPSGLFPPIIKVERKIKETETETKENKEQKRGFGGIDKKKILSIKEIMTDRRDDIKPFI